MGRSVTSVYKELIAASCAGGGAACNNGAINSLVVTDMLRVVQLVQDSECVV